VEADFPLHHFLHFLQFLHFPHFLQREWLDNREKMRRCNSYVKSPTLNNPVIGGWINHFRVTTRVSNKEWEIERVTLKNLNKITSDQRHQPPPFASNQVIVVVAEDNATKHKDIILCIIFTGEKNSITPLLLDQILDCGDTDCVVVRRENPCIIKPLLKKASAILFSLGRKGKIPEEKKCGT
jgi:hypothetical protein